jgi:hypothetical protein
MDIFAIMLFCALLERGCPDIRPLMRVEQLRVEQNYEAGRQEFPARS